MSANSKAALIIMKRMAPLVKWANARPGDIETANLLLVMVVVVVVGIKLGSGGCRRATIFYGGVTLVRYQH